MANVYVGLVHFPVYNKAGEKITSGITNLDIHDISRSALTFGIRTYYLIHPNDRQKEIMNKLLNFWKSELAAFYNQYRVNALSVVSFANSIENAVSLINNQEGEKPIIIATTSKLRTDQISFKNAKELIFNTERPVLLIFGTGNGLHEEVFQQADYVLTPIKGIADYNYLSVRSAVAIILDRLLSEEYKEE